MDRKTKAPEARWFARVSQVGSGRAGTGFRGHQPHCKLFALVFCCPGGLEQAAPYSLIPFSFYSLTH